MFGIKRDEFTPDTPNTHHFDHFLMQMQQSFGSNSKKRPSGCRSTRVVVHSALFQRSGRWASDWRWMKAKIAHDDASISYDRPRTTKLSCWTTKSSTCYNMIYWQRYFRLLFIRNSDYNRTTWLIKHESFSSIPYRIAVDRWERREFTSYICIVQSITRKNLPIGLEFAQIWYLGLAIRVWDCVHTTIYTGNSHRYQRLHPTTEFSKLSNREILVDMSLNTCSDTIKVGCLVVGTRDVQPGHHIGNRGNIMSAIYYMGKCSHESLWMGWHSPSHPTIQQFFCLVALPLWEQRVSLIPKRQEQQVELILVYKFPTIKKECRDGGGCNCSSCSRFWITNIHLGR